MTLKDKIRQVNSGWVTVLLNEMRVQVTDRKNDLLIRRVNDALFEKSFVLRIVPRSESPKTYKDLAHPTFFEFDVFTTEIPDNHWAESLEKEVLEIPGVSYAYCVRQLVKIEDLEYEERLTLDQRWGGERIKEGYEDEKDSNCTST